MLYVLKWVEISKFGMEEHQMGHSSWALGGCFLQEKENPDKYVKDVSESIH